MRINHGNVEGCILLSKRPVQSSFTEAESGTSTRNDLVFLWTNALHSDSIGWGVLEYIHADNDNNGGADACDEWRLFSLGEYQLPTLSLRIDDESFWVFGNSSTARRRPSYYL